MLRKKCVILLFLIILGTLAVSCVNAAPTATFSGSDMYIMPGETKNFELTVKDSDGKLLSDQMVYFQLKGTSQSDLITTSNGKAVFNVKAPTNIGTYSLSYSLIGLSSHSGSGSNNVVVSRPQAYLSGSDLTLSIGESKDFKLMVKDSNGKSLSKQNVYFQLQNTSQTDVVTTNTDGLAVFKIKAPSQGGTYILTYSLTGISTHSGSGTNKISINANSQVISDNNPTGAIVKKEQLFDKTITKYVGIDKVLSKKINKPTKKVKKVGYFKYKYYKVYFVYKKYKIYKSYPQYKEYKVTTDNGNEKREYIGLKNGSVSFTKKYAGTTKKFIGYMPIRYL